MGAIRSFATQRPTVRFCQTVVGVLFAWAALSKLGDLRGFVEMVHNFRIVPIATENVLALTLPWIELVAALSLILEIRPRSGSVVVASMLAAFTLAVLLAIARGLDIECGCFGTADASRVGVQKVLTNLGLFSLAVVGSLRSR